MILTPNDQQLIELALREDLGEPLQDITSEILFTHQTIYQEAKIISKQSQPVIVCGIPVIQALLKKFNDTCVLQTRLTDGATLMPGETLLTLQGPAKTLLMLERTLLNFLQHLCAVATLTAQFVKVVQGTQLKILDTRKTLPGLRHLDKYAVICGGGVNHRMGLYDAIMIKDTHVDLLGGMEKTLALLPNDIGDKYPIIVEVRNITELQAVLNAKHKKITRVLLDNMSVELLMECVSLCRGIFPTEASGSINLDNIRKIAETGIDFASIGALTHSAGNIDLSMQIK